MNVIREGWRRTRGGARRSLAFYPSTALRRKGDSWWPDADRFQLAHGRNQFRLNGSCGPIHAANARIPLRLDDANVLSYLDFFCTFVQTSEGPFWVVNAAAYTFLNWPDISAMLAGFVLPRLLGPRNKAGWQVEALVHYGPLLYLADFSIAPGGMIEMMHDEPLARLGSLRTLVDTAAT